jgi:MATE family multidrug resistance protein
MTADAQRHALEWKLKPVPELVRLAWPITVSMLSYSVMTLVDTVFAGRLGATAVGAVGFGGVVTFTLLCFGLGVLQATKVVISQAIGAGLKDRVLGSVGAALITAIGLGTLFAMLGQWLALLLPHLAADSAAVHLAERYVSLRLLGAPVVLIGFAIRETRVAHGDSRGPMWAGLIANAIHIPLNATLIFHADLGVTGAALSTILSQSLETLLLVFIQRKHGFGLGVWTRRHLSDLWQVGWTIGVERFLNVASYSVLVTVVARVGDTDLAAHQVANQLNMFGLLPMLSVGEAAAVLSGRAVGANEDGMVKRVARAAVGIAIGYGTFCGAIYVFLGPVLVNTLTTDPGVARTAVRLLRVGAAWQAFGAMYIVGAAVLRGVGDIRYATIAMVVIAWVVTPPLAALLGIWMHLGALGGWLALLAEWAAGGFTLWARVEGKRWTRSAERSRKRLSTPVPAGLVAEPART